MEDGLQVRVPRDHERHPVVPPRRADPRDAPVDVSVSVDAATKDTYEVPVHRLIELGPARAQPRTVSRERAEQARAPIWGSRTA